MQNQNNFDIFELRKIIDKLDESIIRLIIERNAISEKIINTVRDNLKKIQSDTPRVTVALIAHNEEKHLLHACGHSVKCNVNIR